MRRILLIISLLLSLFPLRAQISADQRDLLFAKMDEYFAALAGQSAAVQNEECDYMIESCRDSLVRQAVALRIYDHYLQSKLLGDEAVAVHVAETWFLSGKVKMMDDVDLAHARIFVEFNRHSLIGMPAPALTLLDTAGTAVPLFGDVPPGRYSVLYFYDTSCTTCRAESDLLQALLEEKDAPVDFLAVYIGSDAEAWEAWRSDRLAWHTEQTVVRHFWDPEMASEFPRLYNVLSTPQMFFIAPDGTILGRRLDPESLLKLMGRVFEGTDYQYGSDESFAMLREIFARGADTPEDVVKVADYMAGKTLGAGDVQGFKHAIGDLLYWLTGQRGEAFKMGCEAVIDKYILTEESLFTTPEDSLQVVGLAGMVKELMGLAPIGEKVPDVRARGILKQRNRVKERTFRLRRLRGRPSLVVFYTQGCGHCKETLAAVDRLVADPANRRMKVLLVDMDAVFSAGPEEGTRLLESFDLTTLPFAIQLDRCGRVTRKYIDLH